MHSEKDARDELVQPLYYWKTKTKNIDYDSNQSAPPKASPQFYLVETTAFVPVCGVTLSGLPESMATSQPLTRQTYISRSTVDNIDANLPSRNVVQGLYDVEQIQPRKHVLL